LEVFMWSNDRCPFCSQLLPAPVIERARTLGGEADETCALDYAPALDVVVRGTGKLIGAAVVFFVVAAVFVGLVGGVGGTEVTPVGATRDANCGPSYPGHCLDPSAYDCMNGDGDDGVACDTHLRHRVAK
jgi:hypothetical protein